MERNADGLQPVQVAVSKDGPSMETIRYLLEQRPEALRSQDVGGKLVLHHALECGNRPFALLRLLLLQLFPEAALVRDRRGYLPFHIAAATDEPWDVVHLLVRVRPDMVRGG